MRILILLLLLGCDQMVKREQIVVGKMVSSQACRLEQSIRVVKVNLDKYVFCYFKDLRDVVPVSCEMYEACVRYTKQPIQ
jgi:hypothetical protein